ncbi:sulfur carrier protein ThiS [Pseudoroseomonas wenyumeiae]|uniref:Sulfur carrier protein ThiS n=1 Tax=Teichococcus wenyumeiae TaxID=2478470 RepID=A0A3A9J864_9PROT|nr:sulfur carrier protein ThiS [Pseudoroseomonas wenyumeiae]RMI26704.1 sulfur carrier protein ThiS [Pseudoroseomonas wenyumeiae]
MAITVNGESRAIAASATVAVLLGSLGFDSRKVAVERNLEMVPSTAYGATSLVDGDRLEIVHFIGGV